MALIVWTKFQEFLAQHDRKNTKQLYLRWAKIILEKQHVYTDPSIVAILGYATSEWTDFYYVMPIYAPFVPYAGLSETILYYKTRSMEEYRDFASQGTFKLLRFFVIYSLPKVIGFTKTSGEFNVSLDLSDYKDLHIEEDALIYIVEGVIMPKLRPQLLL